MGERITREELKLSLRHYWRMRQFIRKKVRANDKADDGWFSYEVKAAIGETWSDQHCILCTTYTYLSDDIDWDYNKLCGACPLQLNYCGCNEVNSVYRDIAKATTWSELMTALTNMARVILSLPRKR